MIYEKSSSSSFWGATTSEKFWPSQRVSSIWPWCSPSSLLILSLLCRSLHHPPIYILVFLAILLVRVITRILFFTMLLSGIGCTCLNQANFCALIWFIMFLLPVSLFSSSFDLIRHVSSFSLVGPWILLRTFLSNTHSLVFMFSFSTHVSQAYVTTGLTNILYIRSLEFLVNSLLLNRSWLA